MNIRMTATKRIALLAAAVVAIATASAAEVEKQAEEAQAEIEKKLEDARRRLDMAAREVAELSMSMSEHVMPPVHHFVRAFPPRAMLGINLGPRGDEAAEGVPIVSVSPGGAAESAGLKAGDVLLEVGDKPLKRDGDRSPRDVLLEKMREIKPGEEVKVRYRRDNKVATTTVTAQEPSRGFAAPPTAVNARVPGPLPPLAAARVAGVFGSAELVALTPKLGQYFGTEKGLLVVRAPSDSRLKLEDGDVILDIDGRTPSSPSHAFRILGSYQAGEKLKLNVLRQKKKMSFEVTIPDAPAAARVRSFIHHLGDGPDDEEQVMYPAEPGVPVPPSPPRVLDRGISISVLEEPV
jgi:predicted metalloprotease with PDZ domain